MFKLLLALVVVKFSQLCLTLCNSMVEFSRSEYWSGQLFPSPGDLPNPRIKPRSLALQADFSLSWPPEKLLFHVSYKTLRLYLKVEV